MGAISNDQRQNWALYQEELLRRAEESFQLCMGALDAWEGLLAEAERGAEEEHAEKSRVLDEREADSQALARWVEEATFRVEEGKRNQQALERELSAWNAAPRSKEPSLLDVARQAERVCQGAFGSERSDTKAALCHLSRQILNSLPR